MKKRVLLLISVMFTLLINECSGQNFDWVFSTAYYGIGRSLTCDNNGNVYAAGEFIINATFGATTITTPNNNANIFFAKLDSAGNCIWVRNIGSTLYETCFEVACDDSNDVYITGMFDGTVAFGNYILTTEGYYDIFLAKYDPNGTCLCAVQAGGDVDDKPTPSGIAIDENDDIYLTGYFQNVADFNGTQITSNGAWDIYLARYDEQCRI